MNSLETTDIFRGAFFLCQDGDLSEIRFRNNGSRIATFLIRGKGLNKLEKAYRNGRALVNPLQFRESLNHLRDILFEELRKNDLSACNADRQKGDTRMIDQERIDAIKNGVDLKSYIESRGIPLKKNGKSYFGLCPFHNDTNPSLSVNPTKNLWQCFGCGAGGDVISFVELFDKVDFKEAVGLLSAISGPRKASQRGRQPSAKTKTTGAQAQRVNGQTGLTVRNRKLLSKVVSYYQHTLTRDSRGINYLKQERGISDNQAIKDFSVGYVNGTLLEILPVADRASIDFHI